MLPLRAQRSFRCLGGEKRRCGEHAAEQGQNPILRFLARSVIAVHDDGVGPDPVAGRSLSGGISGFYAAR